MKTLTLLFAFLLSACDGNNSTLEKECRQGIGEACNKLGQALETAGKKEEALAHFRLSCEKENTNGCVNYAERIRASNKDEAKRVLKYSCERGNSTACVKFAEILTR